MATKIEEIDYNNIITKASQIANSANEMQNLVKEAFLKIQEMREYWFGNSYDNFINVVNISILPLNKLFEVTVSDIPHEIAAKAKSYAAANQSSVSVNLQEQIALILTEISKTGKGSKIRFKENEVKATQKQIEAKFNSAKANADKAAKISQSLESDWNSISGDSNVKELKRSFRIVKEILERLSNSLNEQITAQATTINVLETAANVVESTSEVAGNAVDTVVDAAANAVNNIQQSAAQLWKNLTGKN